MRSLDEGVRSPTLEVQRHQSRWKAGIRYPHSRSRTMQIESGCRRVFGLTRNRLSWFPNTGSKTLLIVYATGFARGREDVNPQTSSPKISEHKLRYLLLSAMDSARKGSNKGNLVRRTSSNQATCLNQEYCPLSDFSLGHSIQKMTFQP